MRSWAWSKLLIFSYLLERCRKSTSSERLKHRCREATVYVFRPIYFPAKITTSVRREEKGAWKKKSNCLLIKRTTFLETIYLGKYCCMNSVGYPRLKGELVYQPEMKINIGAPKSKVDGSHYCTYTYTGDEGLYMPCIKIEPYSDCEHKSRGTTSE